MKQSEISKLIAQYGNDAVTACMANYDDFNDHNTAADFVIAKDSGNLIAVSDGILLGYGEGYAESEDNVIYDYYDEAVLLEDCIEVLTSGGGETFVRSCNNYSVECNDGRTYVDSENAIQDGYGIPADGNSDLYYDTDTLYFDEESDQWLLDPPIRQTMHLSAYNDTNHGTLFSEDGDTDLPVPDGGKRYLVGVEIEKSEIPDWLSEENEDKGWENNGHLFKEDGSIERGVELSTAKMGLFSSKTDREIASFKDFIEYPYNHNCGVHFTVSHRNEEGDRLDEYTLLHEVEGYIPLLAALYPQRANNEYCNVVKGDHISPTGSRYHLLNICRSNRIEFRIFPPSNSVDTILFRLNLIRYIFSHPNANSIRIFLEVVNQKSKLHLLLQQAYGRNVDRFSDMVKRLTGLTERYGYIPATLIYNNRPDTPENYIINRLEKLADISASKIRKQKTEATKNTEV